MEESHIYLNALRSLPHIGDATLRKILAAFPSPQAAWEAPLLPSEVKLSEKQRESFSKRHQYIQNPVLLFEQLTKEHIYIVTVHEPAYPPLLKEIPDHPYLLYIKGSIDFSQNPPCLAVVGSRKFSPYAKRIAETLVRDIAQAGIVVVSGLAFGVDALAHENTLAVQGKTVGIPGGSILQCEITPRSNQKLAARIPQCGALISEFPPGTEVFPGNFPQRNRIIAGICFGVLVVEAEEKSGSLITARLALDYNREVFAVPGSIFSPQSSGAHLLIQEGAQLIASVQDILKGYTPTHSISKTIDQSHWSKEAKQIFNLLSSEPLHVNALIKNTSLSPALVNQTLALLELEGYIQQVGHQQYIALS